MKSTTSLVAVLFASLFFISCDNDFSVSDDWQDVTVVYSLLDPTADTNWVRIERGYLGNAPASASYDQPDSLYYDSLVVYLLEINTNGDQVDSLYLDRDNTSRDRQPGVFTTQNYRLYRTTQKINEESTYNLVVKKTNAKFTDASASTEIVGGILPGRLNGFTFTNPSPLVGGIREFEGYVYLNPSDRAVIYQIYFTFNYEEYDINTKQSVDKSIYFKYATVDGDAATRDDIRASPAMALFYAAIANQVPYDETKLRFFKDIDMTAYAGGDDLAKYMQLNQPQTGINQTAPEFPGIDNGIGLFSSRTDVYLANVTMRDYIEQQMILSGLLCDRRFAFIKSNTDTQICISVPGFKNELGPYQ